MTESSPTQSALETTSRVLDVMGTHRLHDPLAGRALTPSLHS
jgi:hypothetical protein